MTANTDSLWFMTAHLLVRLRQADNAEGLSIIEHRMAKDFAPPLHIHHQESETFVILEGQFRFQRDGEVIEADVGDTIHLPRNSVHGFRVLSDYGRCLTITNGPFENMVRAASRLAQEEALPEQLPPTIEQQQALAGICSAHAIDLVGAPIV
ncbi:cupin 2 domain-containing protein (plasmid) [Rhizobium sp. NXC14]|uniref:cupin domain-containing protein n=1 Tax=Rhizobium sp. NXC14 TaxID=1981173 RepID=UPI000A208703|nr:cupin domain-containing protein [Rhizobium sp. NXC14]ARO33670.1 cupin 2 domain-containing protein [Rhizobium sp. NXC14]